MHVLSLPAIYALELTMACNNRCPGCSNLHKNDRSIRPLTGQAWESLLAQFGPAAAQIRLTGGEPTLHPQFQRILECATSYEAWVTVFTNGRWRDPTRFVRSVKDRLHFSGLLVSLHGARAEEHEAFSQVIDSSRETLANIRLAIAQGIPVALSTVITRFNSAQLEDMLQLRRDLGATQVVFNRYLGEEAPELEPDPESLRGIVKRIETWVRSGEPVKYGIGLPQCFEANSSEGCLAGVAYVTLDPWGNVRPCSHSPSVIGSLQTSQLSELWHSPAMNAWRALMPGECTSCAAYAVCHGGCRAALELRATRRDPLRRDALHQSTLTASIHNVPAGVRPCANVHLRPEPFGYAVFAHGQVLPVRSEARAVIEACDGSATFSQLADRFGQSGLDLLGELWGRGMLDSSL
jgi:radical SAM protein with 4Fe4S-binding SPASM domain